MKINFLIDGYKLFIVGLVLILFSGFKLEGQIKIQSIEVVTIPGDSISLSLTYNLEDSEELEAKVSLQRRQVTGTPFYKELNGAQGEVGLNILPGDNKMISWSGPLEDNVIDLRLYANYSPEVEIITELVNQIDQDRMLADLELIQGIRHRTAGPAQLTATQDLIRTRLASFNQDIVEETFEFSSTYDGLNIIASQPGCGQDENVWLIGGHYDTVDTSPGADDNGSAIVGMLEAARVLSQNQFEKRIAFVAWDLEEEGLLGSVDFVQRNKDSFGDFEGYLNFEMIGYYSDRPNSQTLPVGFDQLFPAQEQAIANDEFRGNFITNVGNTQNSTELMNMYEAAAGQYVPDIRVISVAAPGTGAIVPDLRRSDHTPFWLADIPALMLTDGANFRNENYHGPEDVLDSLDFNFMANVVKASIATIAQDAIPTICYSDNKIVNTPTNSLSQVYSSNSLVVFPNPANKSIELQLSEAKLSKKDIVVVYKLDGTKLLTQTLGKSRQINVESLSNGLYYIMLQGKSRNHMGSFIIQH